MFQIVSDNLLVQQDNLYYFLGIILWNTKLSWFQLEKQEHIGSVHEFFYAFKSSFLNFLEFFTSIHVAQIVDNYDSLNCHFWCFLTTKYVSLKLACVLRSLIKKNWHAQFLFLIWYSCLGITMNPE